MSEEFVRFKVAAIVIVTVTMIFMKNVTSGVAGISAHTIPSLNEVETETEITVVMIAWCMSGKRLEIPMVVMRVPTTNVISPKVLLLGWEQLSCCDIIKLVKAKMLVAEVVALAKMSELRRWVRLAQRSYHALRAVAAKTRVVVDPLNLIERAVTSIVINNGAVQDLESSSSQGWD